MLPRLKRLEAIGCFPEVLDKLKSGEKFVGIARYIQQQRGELTDIKEVTLLHYLYEWCDQNSTRIRPYRVPTQNLFIGTAEDVDPLQALNALFHLQMDRVRIFVDREKVTRETVRHTSECVRLARELAKDIQAVKSQKDKAMLLSSMGSEKDEKKTIEQMETVKQAYAERYGEKAAAVALNPESRRKVFTALQKVRRGDSEIVLKLLSENDAELKSIQEDQKDDDNI